MIKDKTAMRRLGLPPIEPPAMKKNPHPLVKKDKENIPQYKASYYSRIRKLEQKLDKLTLEASYSELRELVRKFFSEYLGLGYEFTYEELEEELRRRKKNIVFASKNLSKFEYGPHKLTKEALTKMVSEFKQVVKKVETDIDLGKDADEIKKIIQQGKELSGKDVEEARIL
jgi:hypothetical protein